MLSWRDDPYAGTGWHIPGGIIRFQETLETRIHKVAQTELGTDVTFDPVPIVFQEFILPEQRTRGISFRSYIAAPWLRDLRQLTPDWRTRTRAISRGTRDVRITLSRCMRSTGATWRVDRFSVDE